MYFRKYYKQLYDGKLRTAASDIYIKPFIRVVGKLREWKIMVVKVFSFKSIPNNYIIEAVKNYLQESINIK